MKKSLTILILAMMLALAGCGNGETTEKVDETANVMKETLGEAILTPSESVTQAVSGTWNVKGCEDVYVINEDGTGSKNEEAFTFECGFDKDNHIIIKITYDGTESEDAYIISTDSTGYGMIFSVGEEEEWLLPASYEFIEISDERASDIPGTWVDKSGNKYIFGDDMSLTIDGVNNDSEGSYSVVQDSEGKLFLKLVISGSGYEYEFSLNEDGIGMELRSPGSETVHQWTKE